MFRSRACFFHMQMPEAVAHEYALMSSKRIGIIRVEWAARRGKRKERNAGAGNTRARHSQPYHLSKIFSHRLPYRGGGVGVANCRGDIRRVKFIRRPV